jgi:hypothetical protein
MSQRIAPDVRRPSLVTPGKSKVPSAPITSPHTVKSAKKISLLRVILLISITLTGILSGILCYYFIRRYQTLFVHEHFHAMVHDHFRAMKKSFSLLLQANAAVATALSTACPSASKWPNCRIPSRDLMIRTAPLSAMSGVLLFSITPIVRPENRKSFETFAANWYTADGGYPVGTGNSGIFQYDQVGHRVSSPNHTDPSTHRHDFLVPVLYLSVPSSNYFLADTYDDPSLRPTLDEVLDCVNNNTLTPSSDHSCSAITTFIPSEIFSAIATPIMPIQDPNTVVGFVGATFSWQTLFSSAVQQDFDFQCSIQSEASPIVRTFLIKEGVAHPTAGINHPSPSFDGFWRQSQESFVLDPDDILVKETKYTVTYYSSNHSPSPIFALVAGASCVGITFVISMIFVFFNTLIGRAALEASMLLDSKRTYVRFVSHEIR